MNALRRAHLYLSCFFAPMLAFFCLSGVWQTLGWQDGNAHPWLKLLSTIHTGHGRKLQSIHLTSPFLTVFVIVMALSLLVSIGLGVTLAFRYGRGTLAVVSLAGGILIPLGVILTTAFL